MAFVKTAKLRVIVGMSGGVDSSVAAALLLEQGYDVLGLFMKNWEDDDTDEHCTAQADLADANQVCELLGIPLRTVNFSHEYWERVFTRFLAECRAGRTPNPDVVCNREIKFKEFLEWALHLGADFIATGHYARRREIGDGRQLLKGADPEKDQSYFLYGLDQHALARSLFPLGNLAKTDVRATAQSLGLATHDKKDSTGICFIGERKFKTFLSRYLPPRPGEIHDLDGKRIGQHDGLMYYTIGQRHGLGIGGPGAPWYVAEKDTASNLLYVVQGHDHPALFVHAALVHDLHWVGSSASDSSRCQAKTRYRQPDQSCHIDMTGSRARVVFDQPQRAVTPGQSMVFYDGEICLGGGIIEAAVDLPTSATAEPG